METHPSHSERACLQAMHVWRLAGLTHLPRASAVPDLPMVEEELPASVDASPVIESVTATGDTESTPAQTALRDKAAELAAVAERVARCTRCRELAATRTQTVFGTGNPDARVLFLGEAPGADEDRLGEPFVGKAGQKLDQIIAACGWTREEIYICNILRCRPPGNRNPTPEEAANCREYLDAQIQLVQPEYIVCWGSVAATNLLGTTEPIGRLRQKWFEYGGAKVLCTYHPSYILRNPAAARRPVWEDMLMLLKEMGLTPPSQRRGNAGD